MVPIILYMTFLFGGKCFWRGSNNYVFIQFKYIIHIFRWTQYFHKGTASINSWILPIIWNIFITKNSTANLMWTISIILLLGFDN